MTSPHPAPNHGVQVWSSTNPMNASSTISSLASAIKLLTPWIQPWFETGDLTEKTVDIMSKFCNVNIWWYFFELTDFSWISIHVETVIFWEYNGIQNIQRGVLGYN